MLVPNGPETEQGARHALSLRRHIAAHSPTLDDLAAIAVDATGAVMAVASIADRSTQFVVGAFNCHVESFPRTHAKYDHAGEFYEITHLDQSPAYTAHPMLGHPDGPIRSALITGLFHQGIVIGGFGIGSSLPEGAFTQHHRTVMLKLARVAESVIRSEVALSRMASEALAVLTGDL